ncbi:MAG: cyclic nucleotide-binding domain-containing protein [Anaerolineae bacterium]
MSEIKNFLKNIEMFMNLSDDILDEVAKLCYSETYETGRTIIKRNSSPTHFYLIQEGTVEIIATSNSTEAVVVTLGKGQSFGEMGLVDNGMRSATVKAVTETSLQVINCEQFRHLCETNTNLGYQVMRNIAADLSFKLRNRNLI